MNKSDFEDFLIEKHDKQYRGCGDDGMPDDFNKWLGELGIDYWIEYGDLFAKEQSKKLLLEVLKDVDWFKVAKDICNTKEKK